jgi:hypothetical protein
LPDENKREIYYDFWVTGGNRFEVYTTEPHKKCRLARHDYRPDRIIRADQPENLKWDTVGEWTFKWVGPFYVAATKDARYFITDAGRVYGTPNAGKPMAPVVELWKGAPIELLIHDANKKTWFAFTKNEYFEVADPIVPKPHSIPVCREWLAEHALDMAAKCGRVVRRIPEPKAK